MNDINIFHDILDNFQQNVKLYRYKYYIVLILSRYLLLLLFYTYISMFIHVDSFDFNRYTIYVMRQV